MQLAPSSSSTFISSSSSSISTSFSRSSSISSSLYTSSSDSLLWRADAANAQGPHYRQYLTAPLKLLNGGVPVPATLSQKIAANSGASKNDDIRVSFGQMLGGLGRRQPGLGSKLRSETRGRISEDPAPSPPEPTL